jgi:putative oxidoreductase
MLDRPGMAMIAARPASASLHRRHHSSKGIFMGAGDTQFIERLFAEAPLDKQRIFSTFPDGGPGCGLLLLRVAGTVPLFAIGLSTLWGGSTDVLPWVRLIGCVSGALLLMGFWTPLAAALQAFLAGMFAFDGACEPLYLMHASIGISLAMLGPGYWSIDARLYGRKRIDLNRPPRGPRQRS